jgi:ABC-type multidrug transport system fused ATPase/permease subunit
VIKGIDLEVNAGQTRCHCRLDRCWKKSIINLLNRFYEINSGSIYIDNQNIENYTLVFYANSSITRCFPFADDTIFNNITLNNPEISREWLQPKNWRA